MRAEVTLEYDDPRLAGAVAKAVTPDNFKTPIGLSIRTTVDSNKVVTRVNSEGKFSTFIATIDDLLFCVSTAEKTLRIVSRLQRRKR